MSEKITSPHPPIISLKSVDKEYKMDGVVVGALKNVSLNIKAGEFVSIIGKSGSGKSTLMHIIGCLDTPSSGQLIINGHDISKLNEASLAKIRNQYIGFVFQSFNLLARTTALDNVLLPTVYGHKKDAKEKALEILNRVGLKDRTYHFPNQLSGGQQQRVAIARALVMDPSVILADEPTGNLDTKSSEEILKIFEELNQEGKTVVIVTHDLAVAKRAKRIIRITDGEIV